MNAQLRSALILEPRPASASDVRVHLVNNQWRCCWLVDGRIPQSFGPAFANVAEAAAAARLVREAWGMA